MAKIALLIGVSEYEHEPELKHLPAAVKDVEAIKRVLVNPEMGGFAEPDVTVLKNPQRQEMEEAIYRVFANRQKDDLLLFYFSGHGVKDDSGKLFLSTRATRKDNGRLVKPTAVAASFLHESMNESKSERQVIILDCCFSGAFPKGLTVKDDGTVNLQEQLGGKGRAILTSSTSTQYSFEQEGSELSIYTRYLVEGIDKGAADLDNDGWISAEELHGYASSKVKEAAPAMTPEIYLVKEAHKILLAKSPKDDPKLKYRKEVERSAKREGGKFSDLAKKVLNGKRVEFKLSEQDAKEIEDEVLQPFREYERKLQEYEEVLIEEVRKKYPFNEDTEAQLKEYQKLSALRDEDIAAIEKRVIPLRADQTFDFEMATISLVKKGEQFTHEIKRSRKQAEFFAEELGNEEILEMVAIPGGTFVMGSSSDEPKRWDSESPQHSVTIKPFFMGKFQATQAQWQIVAGFPKVKIDLNADPSYFKGAKLPVEQVSWYEAVEFCDRLSQKTGRNYRLPSEAEWEYACRAGTTTPFHFGKMITTDLANYNGNYQGIYREQTTEVGSFPPNAFGLYDMHGNVWECCDDHWHENYKGAPNDGSRWLSSDENYLWVRRGGSWSNDPEHCRSALRINLGSGDRYKDIGFRVVCAAAWT